MANRLDEIMQIANAGKQLNAPRAGVQKVVNADGTVTEIPYMEDRFGRRTVMTSQGPRVIRGHEGKDVYGDLGGKIGNVLGGLINKGRLGRQERIAEKSVAQQERASFPRGPGALVLPPAPENLAEVNRARERLNYKTPQEKINYFDMSTVQSSAKPSDLSQKLNMYLPEGVTHLGRVVNCVRTDPATREQLQEAMGKIRLSTGSRATQFKSVGYKNGLFVQEDNAGNFNLLTPQGTKIEPGDPTYASLLQAAIKSGIDYSGNVAFATGQGKDRSARMTEISGSIGIAEGKQAIYGDIITAIDDGAKTGYITDLFPSMTEATVALNNLQGELGLNVLQSTTFGALSKDELKFALSTALPTSMEPEALRRWVVRKQEAQRKLIDYLYEAGDYIGQGGTQFGFMAKKRRERGGTPDVPSAGADAPDLKFIPEEKRADAAKALKDGTATLEQLREMYPQ